MQHDYEGGAKLVAPFVIHTIDSGGEVSWVAAFVDSEISHSQTSYN